MSYIIISIWYNLFHPAFHILNIMCLSRVYSWSGSICSYVYLYIHKYSFKICKTGFCRFATPDIKTVLYQIALHKEGLLTVGISKGCKQSVYNIYKCCECTIYRFVCIHAHAHICHTTFSTYILCTYMYKQICISHRILTHLFDISIIGSWNFRRLDI